MAGLVKNTKPSVVVGPASSLHYESLRSQGATASGLISVRGTKTDEERELERKRARESV